MEKSDIPEVADMEGRSHLIKKMITHLMMQVLSAFARKDSAKAIHLLAQAKYYKLFDDVHVIGALAFIVKLGWHNNHSWKCINDISRELAANVTSAQALIVIKYIIEPRVTQLMTGIEEHFQTIVKVASAYTNQSAAKLLAGTLNDQLSKTSKILEALISTDELVVVLALIDLIKLNNYCNDITQDESHPLLFCYAELLKKIPVADRPKHILTLLSTSPVLTAARADKQEKNPKPPAQPNAPTLANAGNGRHLDTKYAAATTAGTSSSSSSSSSSS